jgi:hypothetical protein
MGEVDLQKENLFLFLFSSDKLNTRVTFHIHNLSVRRPKLCGYLDVLWEA